MLQQRYARLYLGFSCILLAFVVFFAIGANSATAVVILLVAATVPPLLMLALWTDGPSSSQAISEVMHAGERKPSFRDPNATS